MPNLDVFSIDEYVNYSQIPLARYLPPYQPGVLPKMLKIKGVTSGWILDPLGSQPLAAIDLANHGFKVFVSCNNPIIALITEVLSLSPVPSEWNSVLAELGNIRIREERLETFLQKPFTMFCPKCGQTTKSVSFIWLKGSNAPHKKIGDCVICKNKSEENVTEQDLVNLSRIGNTALHQSRAIQRIFSDQEPFPQTLQFIQEAYLQRAIAFIVPLFNHLDGLKTNPTRKKMLEVLIISAFDHATTLWPHNQFSTRPRQIITPNEFIEVNLWQVMEKTAAILGSFQNRVPFETYPNIPPIEGGICLYPNRYRENELPNLPDFQAVVSILPRPNQALWSLSSIWSGWLWGNQSALQIKSALTRQRYDWFWLTNALKKIFNQTSKNIHWLAISPELTPGYTISYLAAASANGFRLNDFFYSANEKNAQYFWDKSYTPIAIGSPPTLDKMLVEYLEQKGDSAHYSELFNYYILRAAKEGLILKSGIIPDGNLFANIQKRFEQNLQNAEQVIKIDQDLKQYGEYWLKSPSENTTPFLDTAEELFFQFSQQEQFTMFEIKQAIDKQLPKYLPVPHDWLQKLLNSYCVLSAPANQWSLKPQELLQNRKQDIEKLLSILHRLGKNYLMDVNQGSNYIFWKNDQKEIKFFITSSSNLFQYKAFCQENSEIFVLYPGSRAPLLVEKLKKNILYKDISSKLHSVKFRHIRFLDEIPNLDFPSFYSNLDSDPALGEEYAQLAMF